MVVSADDEVLLLLNSELPTRFPGWYFRFGKDQDYAMGMSMLIIQFSQQKMFEKFGSFRSWEECFLIDPSKPTRETVNVILTKMTFYLDARKESTRE